MSNPPYITQQDKDSAGYCDHGQRVLRQGRKKDGGAWRGEFCFLDECQPLWWSWNPQIEVQGKVGLWIRPIYEPMDFVYHGLKGSPWENK